jgi:hypothetical protein
MFNDEEDNFIIISFNTEQDRIKGIGSLFRSNFRFDGKGKNRFLVSKEHCKMLNEKDINYNIINKYIIIIYKSLKHIIY